MLRYWDGCVMRHAPVQRFVVQCGAVWCSVVQRGALWCSVVQLVQCVAVRFRFRTFANELGTSPFSA